MKKPILVLHGLVFLVGCLTTILILVAGFSTELMFFLPIVITVWINVHLALGLIQFLDWLGQKRAGAKSSKRWPLPLIFTLIIYFMGTLQALGMLAFVLKSSQPWTFLRTVETIMLFFQPIIFLGLLLRFPWARILAGGGLIVSGVIYLFAYMAANSNANSRLTLEEWILFGGLNFALITLGISFLMSLPVRAFFVSRKPWRSEC